MRKQLLLLLFSLFAVVGYARTVTGVVTSASDTEPIIGAAIQVEGSSRGTVTDFDGNYSIEAQDNETLVFSYVGMTPQKIKVGGRDVINVVLKDNAQVLEEVVVTAMGQTQEKKKLNFAVQSLNSDDVTAGQSSNFANSLQGKVAGLQVSQGGGAPNSSTQVIIRAISSINPSQSNEPLVIVDGMPIRGGGSSLGDLNANDIENMSVLKGAAASALYGQEAANGVIMITTKRGKEGSLNVQASGSWEFSNAIHIPKIQDQFMAGSQGFYKENMTSGGWGPYLTSEDRVYDNVGDFLGTGFTENTNVNVSQKKDGLDYSFGISNSYQKGIIPSTGMTRWGARGLVEYIIYQEWKTGFSMNYTSSRITTTSGAYAWYISSFTEQEFGSGNNQLMKAELRNANELASSTTYNNEWNGTYSNLMNLKQIIAKTSEESTTTDAGQLDLMGMAQVLTALNFGVLTDLHGDIPCSEALQGLDNIQPSLDKQEDVYKYIFVTLDAAIGNLSKAKDAGMANVGEQDILYGNDLEQWIAAAYALKARYKLHTLYRNPAVLSEVIDAASKAVANGFSGMYITSFNGVTCDNPWSAYVWSRLYTGCTTTVGNIMLATGDPRIDGYCFTEKTWLYGGTR